MDKKYSKPKITTAAEINIDSGDRGCDQHLLDSCMGSIILSMYCPRLFVLNTYWGGKVRGPTSVQTAFRLCAPCVSAIGRRHMDSCGGPPQCASPRSPSPEHGP